MKPLYVISVVFLLFVVHISSKKFPSFIHRCKRNDPNISACFLKVVDELRPRFGKGIPELNLNSLDPMVIPKVSVANYTGTSLGVDAEFTNMTFYGGKDFVVKRYSVDFDKGECYAVLLLPKIHLITNYRIKGKILILDIDSSGKAEAKFNDCVITSKLKMTKYQKNGKDHMKFHSDVFDFDVGKASFHLDNIFPNNPDITENTNLVLNENMDALMQDIKPIVIKTAKDILLSVINGVYDAFPYEELWPLE